MELIERKEMNMSCLAGNSVSQERRKNGRIRMDEKRRRNDRSSLVQVGILEPYLPGLEVRTCQLQHAKVQLPYIGRYLNLDNLHYSALRWGKSELADWEPVACDTCISVPCLKRCARHKMGPGSTYVRHVLVRYFLIIVN